MSMPLFRKISKGQRGASPCQHPYSEEFLRCKGDESMEGGSNALEKPSPSFEEWSYWIVKDM